MPEEDLEHLVEDIQAGRDNIIVPEELVIEPEERPSSPERQSMQQMIQNLKSGERLKLALRGNREARAILIRDTSLIVRRCVLFNPRVSEEEIVMLARNRQVDRELLDVICRSKEWLNNYQVRLGIVTNPKTPITISLKYIGTLMMRDLRHMAKSKNVPSVVNSAAKRIVLRSAGG